ISVVVFPEGTFNTTPAPVKEFYDGAFRLAIETQTPLKPVLFLDTYARMHYNSLFTLNPGISRVVYLAEIPVAGLTIADIEPLKQKAHAIMSEKLKQYQASWIGHESQPE
ncbi:MAG TPA: 1-acyl-sn-glycerol-3-phosphate acyltransferase, partial [Chitinophagaceae bacterium]|nr:1-acyl-sn-glycerol-3-phosphate acyltransferase [Chitinophagaceae bacterium]